MQVANRSRLTRRPDSWYFNGFSPFEGEVNSVKDSGEVEVRGDLEKAIRILKKKLAREGFFRELKKRRHYEKPSIKRRKKSQEAQKRRKKFERREATS
jgi:small subunit ribosomal protein S21